LGHNDKRVREKKKTRGRMPYKKKGGLSKVVNQKKADRR